MAVSVSAGAIASKVAHLATGKIPHWFKRSFATTDLDGGDELRVLYGPFPPGHKLDPASLKAHITDMDTGSAALDWTLAVCDIDGVGDTNLIVADQTDPGGAAAGDMPADAPNAQLIDVGGKYLGWETDTAAATPAAGTIEVYVETVKLPAPETIAAAAA